MSPKAKQHFLTNTKLSSQRYFSKFEVASSYMQSIIWVKCIAIVSCSLCQFSFDNLHKISANSISNLKNITVLTKSSILSSDF